MTKVFTSGDLKEGPHAFVEERPSAWRRTLSTPS